MDRTSIITGQWDKHEGYQGVYIDGELLSPDRSLRYRNHSPDGFSWGYTGSGPSQFALALLLEATDEVTALGKYQKFKRDVIANLPERFSLNADVIYKWLEDCK